MAAKSKKKNPALAPILLLAAILVLFLLYRVMDAKNQADNASSSLSTQTDVTMILDRDVSEVTAISYSWNGEENAFTWNSSTGVWEYDADKNFPLVSDPLSTMAAAVCSIGVYRTLDTGDTGVYGFDAPAAAFSVSFKDGSTYRYQIGDINTVSGYRYLKDLDTGTVYTISAALLPYLQYSLGDLFSYDSLPTDIETGYITSITLKTPATERSVTDSDECTTLYTKLQLLAPMEYADYSGTDAAKEQYGIGAATLTVAYRRAVSVTDSDSGTSTTTRIAATYEIQFGDLTEDGKIPYTLTGSDVIYLADASYFNTIESAFPTEE